MTDFATTFRRDSLAAQLAPRLGIAQLLDGAGPNALAAAVGRCPVPSPELIDRALAGGDAAPLEALAAHPRTPAPVLARVAADRRGGVATALLDRPGLPVEAALVLAGRPDGQAALSLAVRGELPLWARLRVARGMPFPGRRSAARLGRLPSLRIVDFAAALGLALQGVAPDVLDELLKAAGRELTVVDWQVAVHAAVASPDPLPALAALARPLRPGEPITATATAALGAPLIDALRRPGSGDPRAVAAAWAQRTPVPVWDALAALPSDPAAAVTWPAAMTRQLLGSGQPLPLTVAAVAAHLPGADPETVALRRATLFRLPGLGRGLESLTVEDALALLTDPRMRGRNRGVWTEACREMLAATGPEPEALAGVPVLALVDLLVVGTGPFSDVVADLVAAAFAVALGEDEEIWRIARLLIDDGFPGTLWELAEVCAATTTDTP